MAPDVAGHFRLPGHALDRSYADAADAQPSKTTS